MGKPQPGWRRLRRHGPFSTLDAAEDMAARLAAICRVLHAQVHMQAAAHTGDGDCYGRRRELFDFPDSDLGRRLTVDLARYRENLLDELQIRSSTGWPTMSGKNSVMMAN